MATPTGQFFLIYIIKKLYFYFCYLTFVPRSVIRIAKSLDTVQPYKNQIQNGRPAISGTGPTGKLSGNEGSATRGCRPNVGRPFDTITKWTSTKRRRNGHRRNGEETCKTRSHCNSDTILRITDATKTMVRCASFRSPGYGVEQSLYNQFT